MKKELDYFWIEDSYGGNQDWFATPMMRLGGCAAETACDSCIYLAKEFGKLDLCPYPIENINKKEYVEFSKKMEPYLKPRMTGINKLDIYIEGFLKYLRDCGEQKIEIDTVSGSSPIVQAKKAVVHQIDNNIPLPCLTLKHKDLRFKDYVWHWFLLTGYEIFEDKTMVKAVTYSEWEWLPLEELWDTGYREKGGLILYSVRND